MIREGLSMEMRWNQVLSGLTIAALVGMPGVAQAQTPGPVEQTNHTLQYGTYLGGNGQDQHRGVGITTDDKVITAGNFETLQIPSGRQTAVLGAVATAKGKLIKLAADGKTIEAVVTLGDRIDDMELRRDPNRSIDRDRLVVAGSFGVAVLNPASMKVIWSQPWPKITGDTSSASNTIRASIDSQGQVAAIRGKYVTLWTHQGTFKASQFIDRDAVTDIVMDPLSTRRQLYVVGFANRKNVNDGNNPVQVPFFYALDTYNLGRLWKLWDYDPNTLTTPATETAKATNNMADGRLYRVVAGMDGTVAVAGESAGGNSVYRWNGIDLATPTRMVCDAYDNPYNAKSAHIVYYAKIDTNPAAGRVIVGQFAFPRQQSAPGQTGVTNTFRVREGSLDLDQAGNLYLGGQAFSYLPNRDMNRISGVAPGTYNGNSADMALLQVSADMKRRIRFMPLAGAAAGGGFANAIAVKGDRVAIAGTVRLGYMATGNSLVSTPFNPEYEKATGPNDIDDAYLGVFSGMTPAPTAPARKCAVAG
jgi:hypothetical protein